MNAVEYYKSGFSCAESIVMEAIELGLCDESMLCAATPFSGGLSSGCLCGAISGSQIVIGMIFGKNNKYGNEVIAKKKAQEFITRFKEKYPATCCRVISRGFEFNSPERKQNCMEVVEYCSKLLKEAISYERV